MSGDFGSEGGVGSAQLLAELNRTRAELSEMLQNLAVRIQSGLHREIAQLGTKTDLNSPVVAILSARNCETSQNLGRSRIQSLNRINPP